MAALKSDPSIETGTTRVARQAAGTASATKARAQTIALERGEEELDGSFATEAARVSLSATLQKLD
eukprot:11918107-Alexandrium_andersonii.AAC.1